MILSEIWAEVGRLLNDPNNQRWSQDVITFRSNQAATIIQGYTNAVKTKETLTPVASVATVTLDSDTMDIVRVVITRPGGEKVQLDGITREDLDFDSPNWQQLSPGAPYTYFYDATLNQINLIPEPDASNAITSGLEVWEVLKPAALSAAGDIPFDSTTTMIPYHMAIVHWVVAQCWLDDGTPEAIAKARVHRSGVLTGRGAGEFEQQLMRIIAKFDSPEDIPSRIKFRPQGGRLGAWLPSKAYPFG